MQQQEANRAEELRQSAERYEDEKRLREAADARAATAALEATRAAQQQFDMMRTFMEQHKATTDKVSTLIDTRGAADTVIASAIADAQTTGTSARSYEDWDFPVLDDVAKAPADLKWDETKPELVDKTKRALEWRKVYQKVADVLNKAAPVWARQTRNPITKIPFSAVKYANLDTSKAPGHQRSCISCTHNPRAHY